ncbi:tetratricopeptide repeat protein [Gemella cuniculi]|uniref:tetratricopeptide repeat protein n=1 Tax=Gemella cuniculi TaxID=150240 RepID=UPI000488F535|nr:hypothetical protein [Gemella cuniculi]
MNDKKFWKIIYLYIIKYNYNILYYRPEKKDVWLINEDNELIRFIYSESFKTIEIDTVVSNVIRNEVRLKKMFKLNNLKIKILYFSPEFDEISSDYKRYKISDSLAIERVLYNEKNKKLFIKEKDLKFIEDTPDTLRYKNRVVELYKKQTLEKNIFDVKFNILSGLYILLFIINYLLIYLTEGKFSLYKYLDYSYQGIISGQFYRVFTSSLVVNDIKSLGIIVLTVFISSILFNKTLNILHTVSILFLSSLIFNLLLIFGYSGQLDIMLVSYFSVLGSIFLNQLSKRNDNLKFMYSCVISFLYLVCMFVFFDTAIILYLFAFILGAFLQLFILGNRNIYVLFTSIAVVVVLGFIVSVAKINTKVMVNNYRLSQVEKRLIKPHTDEDIFNLERELGSKNKSILTYYELGMIKMMSSSIQDAKKVFLEGVEFDETFAPIYYNLGLIERQEGNYNKGREYAQKAYDLNKIDKYKNLVEELSNY